MMRTEKVSFPSEFGQTLHGRLEIASHQSKLYAIFAHCFACSKNSHAASRISRALARHNFNVLRFDFTGVGESSGQLRESHFGANISDILAAAKFLEQNYAAPILLIGHSLGGSAVLAAANQLTSVQAVSTIAAPYDPEHIREHFNVSLDDLAEEGSVANVAIAGKRFDIDSNFLRHLQNHNQFDAIHNLKRPLLIFHSPEDNIVPIENAKKIYEAAHHPKSFVSLDKADHLLTDKSDAEYVASTLASWCSRYVDKTKHISQPRTSIHVFGNDNYLQQRIEIGEHQIFADEPLEFGGTDQGATPYELLLASLGSCTAMTLVMYAKRKNWQLDDIHVTLTHHRIHAKDCQLSEQADGMVDVIERDISFGATLSADQLERLQQIADRCPVHKTLTNKPVIKTTISRVSGN